MIKKIALIITILISTSLADNNYKTITRAKYNQMKQESKVALVIGNRDYEQDALTYSISDAKRVKDFFESRGFTVIYKTDIETKGKMRELINQFIASISPNGVGIFYFSGHGMSAYNENYLIPLKNSSIATDADIEDVGMRVNYLLKKLEEKENRLNIVMLDACRNNLGKGSSSTLLKNSAEGVYIAYATADGARAMDNGLFASSFVENAKIAGLTVEEVFKKVRTRVKEKTGQTPFESSSIIGDFYFTLPSVEEPKPEPEPVVKYEPQMVHISRGSYMMGSDNGDADEKPTHQVNINYDFEIGKYEVSVGEFRNFVNDTGYKTEAEKDGGCYVYNGTKWEKDANRDWKSVGFSQNDNHPVACVSWNDSKAYTKWISGKTGKNYRLPTEAEWEFVARAGTKTKWSFGDQEKSLCSYGNVADQTAKEKYSGWTIAECRDGYVYTAPRGSFGANQWGAHDMHGNVWEWCEDWYLESYNRTPKDGGVNHSQNKNKKVLRGGSWGDVANSARSASRYRFAPTYRDYNVGFRLQRTLP